MLDSDFTLEDIFKNDSYFSNPKRLRRVFFEHFKAELRKNKNNKEKFESSHRDLLKELEGLKISNAKKAFMKKQFNAALREVMIKADFRKSLRKSVELKSRLMRLRKILARRRMRYLRRKRQIKALEEFENMIEMQRLQLERYYEDFLKKLEEEKRRYLLENSDQKPSEVADNLTDHITGSCEILSDILDLDLKVLLPKKDRELLKNDFLCLELILRSEIEDSEEFDKRILDVFSVLENVYDVARKEISDDDMRKSQTLDKWCKQMEILLAGWLNNEIIEKFDQAKKEEMVQILTQEVPQEKPSEEDSFKFFTPLRIKPEADSDSISPRLFSHQPHLEPPSRTGHRTK